MHLAYTCMQASTQGAVWPRLFGTFTHCSLMPLVDFEYHLLLLLLLLDVSCFG